MIVMIKSGISCLLSRLSLSHLSPATILSSIVIHTSLIMSPLCPSWRGVLQREVSAICSRQGSLSSVPPYLCRAEGFDYQRRIWSIDGMIKKNGSREHVTDTLVPFATRSGAVVIWVSLAGMLSNRPYIFQFNKNSFHIEQLHPATLPRPQNLANTKL
jgi:hypothetical protein